MKITERLVVNRERHDDNNNNSRLEPLHVDRTSSVIW
jgi:hypothetical protein